MSQPLARQSKNLQFSHAAAAMGAFWECARKSDDRRIRRVRQMVVERTRALIAGSSEAPVAGPSLRRSF